MPIRCGLGGGGVGFEVMRSGHEMNFFPLSHVALKYFKVVANS